MTTDLRGALRRRKPEKRLARLAVRALGELTGAADLSGAGPVALVPDTGVYIRNAAGLLPPAVQALLDRARLFHCSVCLAELAIGVANADPSRANWADLRGTMSSFSRPCRRRGSSFPMRKSGLRRA